MPEARDAQVDAADHHDVLAKVPEGVLRDLERGRTRDLLIELVDQGVPDAGVLESQLGDADAGDLTLARSVRPTEESVSERAERYRQLQERVLSNIQSDAVELRHQYENVPLLFMRVHDLAGLLLVARQGEVLIIHEDMEVEHQLAESLPLMVQPAVAADGQLGAGTAVAVLDTGCDYTRAAFGSCASPGAAGCKVAYARDFGVSDNARDTGNFHGTNVAGIVLGVAPATKILALDVFEGTTAMSSTIIQGIDWVISNRATYNIVAMNLSLGSGSFTSACGTNVFASAIDSARNAGILSAIASGNSRYTNAISAPACVPSAISVGAVYDANVGPLGFTGCSDTTTAADKVTCFSNSASFLSMLAPGAPITAAGLTMTGTSQASPHVAGAIAVARAVFPNEPLSATVSRLVNTGPSVRDHRNGVTLHRLDLNAALGGNGVVDVTAPTGTLTINQGATATRSTTVSLSLTASDDGGPVTMCISHTPACTTFSPFAATKSWALKSGAGLKTVYVTLRDPSNNRTTLSKTIMLDNAAPTGGTLTATRGDGQVQLNWTPAYDAHSGIAMYRVQAVVNAKSAPTCTTGTTIYSGTGTSFTHTGLTNGATYTYRLCPIDAASNIGKGTTAAARPAPEFDGPVGTVTINAGATYTNKTAVTLTLSATDVSGVAAMCISNTTSCSAFVAYTTSRTWNIASANGTATVRVWFRDIYGNVSAAPAMDTIILDRAAPKTSSITAVAGNASVALSWTASSDAHSGLDGYKVVMAAGATPTCAAGTQVYSGSALSTTVSNLTNGTTYTFRVCPRDAAGNLANGGTTSSRPAPEFNPPVGSVTINEGATLTKSKAVTLTLSATDASGVAAVCISNTTTCKTFSAFTSSKPWTLSVANGTATVRVWYRDIYGNVSAAPVTDTILVDTAPPSTPKVTAVVSSGRVNLSWTASTDSVSGVAGYRVRYALTRAPTCTTGTEIYSGTDRTFQHTGLTNGLVYGYRVCPFDVAGNVSSGGALVATPR